MSRTQTVTSSVHKFWGGVMITKFPKLKQSRPSRTSSGGKLMIAKCPKLKQPTPQRISSGGGGVNDSLVSQTGTATTSKRMSYMGHSIGSTMLRRGFLFFRKKRDVSEEKSYIKKTAKYISFVSVS